MNDQEARIILALDVPTLSEVEKWLTTFSGRINFYKIGSRLFTASGPAAIKQVKAQGGRVFLDLKFHDIPNTVGEAAAEAVRLGVDMLNLHVLGGKAMMEEAVRQANATAAEEGTPRPRLLGVTVLTSTSSEDLALLGIRRPLAELVLDLAESAREAGLDGVVASALEAEAIKRRCGKDFLVVAPGVRPPGTPPDDQKRILSPREALAAGADYIVVGRPLLKAENPRSALDAFFN